MKTKWGTVTATEPGITQPRRRINTTNKSNRRDVNTFVVTPHPVSLSQGVVFLSLVLCLRLKRREGFTGEHLRPSRVCGVGAAAFTPSCFHHSGRRPRIEQTQQSTSRSLTSQRCLQTHNGATLGSARGQRVTWRLGNVKFHSGPRLKVGGGSEIRRRSWWWRWAVSSTLQDWPSAQKGHLVHTPEKHQGTQSVKWQHAHTHSTFPWWLRFVDSEF